MIRTTLRPLLVPLLLLAAACGTSTGARDGSGSTTNSVDEVAATATPTPPPPLPGTDDGTLKAAFAACSDAPSFAVASVKVSSERARRGHDSSTPGQPLPPEAEVNACADALKDAGFRVCTVNATAGAILLHGDEAERQSEMPACVKDVEVFGMASASGVAGVTN